MNYLTTKALLEALNPYTDNASIHISTVNKDWQGKEYKSDFVMIDEKNHVGFEVFDNEILVFYFTDHCHFEDYSYGSENEGADYIKRAKDFLMLLFENRIKYIEIYKGKKLASEKYYFVYADNTEKHIGTSWSGFITPLNPLAKKKVKITVWKFNRAEGRFVVQ